MSLFISEVDTLCDEVMCGLSYSLNVDGSCGYSFGSLNSAYLPLL